MFCIYTHLFQHDVRDNIKIVIRFQVAKIQRNCVQSFIIF